MKPLSYNNIRAAVFAFAVVAGFCVSLHSAYAAYPIEKIPGADEVYGDFVVGPTKVDLTIAPGEQKQLELMVTNRMGERRRFDLVVEDAKGSTDPNTTVVLLGDDRGPYSLRDYISFPEASFELEQGERARIPVTISIPQDAQPGGLYGSVLVTTHSVATEADAAAIQAGAKAGSVIVSRIGALFFITVPGAVDRAGTLQSFDTSPKGKRFWNKSPIEFQILFENTGSVHLNPSAELSIKNMLGEEVGSLPVEPWYVFPQSVRMREISWNRDFLFGRYTAELRLNRGYDNLEDTASVTFYVIPWQIILGGFGALVLIFFMLRFIARTFEIKRR